MNLKNYSSSVPMINSIARIEHRLAQAGATHIAKSYDKERPIGMIFQIPINEIPLTFKLPAKAEKVLDFMIKQKSRPPKKTQLENMRMQADRTAWKILADMVDIQVSNIQIDQTEPTEAFLSYLYDGNKDQTLFEKMKEASFNIKQLTK
jgi:hypothetical protein